MLGTSVFVLLVLALCQLGESKYTIAFKNGRKTLVTDSELNQLVLEGMESHVSPRAAPIEDDIDKLVTIGLFTRLNKDNYTELKVNDPVTLVNSNFDFSHPTKVVIHGYLNNMGSDAIQTVKNAYLDNYDFNVIGVDWGLIAMDPLYTVAANQTERVGRYVAEFLDFLMSAGVSPDDIHLTGHSLGAHVCGFAGQYVTKGKVARITGNDPALPYFYTAGPNERLDPTDAQFVDCIHTCGGVYGFLAPICTVDFYPNGGVPEQPGCPPNLAICSHSRSFVYYSESMNVTHTFSVESCTDRPDRAGDGCTPSDVIMGYPTSTSETGIYWGKTHSSAPFAPNQ